MSLDKLEANKARWTIKCEDQCSDIFLEALANVFYDVADGVKVARLTKQTLNVSLDVNTEEDLEKVAVVDEHAALLDRNKGEVIYRSVPEL